MASETSKPRWRLSSSVVFIGLLAVAAFFLFTEHRAHVLGWLPILLFVACPLMHLMHGGHGGHGHHRGERGTQERRQESQHRH